MAGSPVIPTPVTRSTHRALVMLACAVLLVALAIAAVALHGTGAPAWQPILFLSVALSYLFAGVLAWWRRPSNPLGAIMVVGCLALLIASLAITAVPVLIAAATIGATPILAVMVHLLHAFPSGRLRSRVSRWTVAVGYFTSLVLEIPLYLFAPAPPPAHLVGLADRPALVSVGLVVQSVVGAAVMVVTMLVLVRRLRLADPPHRRVLGPLYAYGVLVVLFIPLSANLAALFSVPQETLGTAQLLAIGGVPLAFCLGLLRGGFARTRELEELGLWLGGTGTARTTVTEALAATLGDPTLTVAFRNDDGQYVDATGSPVELPAAGGDREVVQVEVEGHPVGVIEYDATLLADPAPVRAAGRVVALAVERERLTAQLRAGAQALRESRERLVEAADRERRRIAQNLHDGPQARLVVLALAAQRLATGPGVPSETAAAATTLRRDIDAAAGELRRFVHGVMPAPLVERGLSAAAEDLVDQLPLPTRLELGINGLRLPAAVESTAYFVLAEALTNAVRHADATTLALRLTVREDTLVIEVGDDGVGGAHLNGGLGLRSLTDRVDALGGRLVLDSTPGSGTRIIAELPCGS